MRSAICWGLSSALLVPSITQAWDRIVTEHPDSAPVDFYPRRVTTPGPAGFWAFGYAGSSPVFVHYDATDAPTLARPLHVNQQTYGFGFFSLVDENYVATLPDGGFFFGYSISSPFAYPYAQPGPCYLQRYDGSGNFQWQTYMGDTGPGGCIKPLGIDGQGGVWFPSAGGGPIRLGVDGAASAPVTLGPYDPGHLVPDSTTSDVYAFATLPGGIQAIARFTANGTQKWQLPISGADSLQKLVLGADGNLYAFGIALPVSFNNFLFAASITSSGVDRWAKTLPVSLNFANIVDAEARTSGEAYLSTVGSNGVTGTAQLWKIDADGSFGWSKVFSSSSSGCTDPDSARVAVSPNGDALFFYALHGFCSAPTLYRFKPDGSQTYAISLPGIYSTNAAIPLLDDTTLLVGPDFTRVAADGSMLAPPSTSRAVGGSNNVAAKAMADDGSSFFLYVPDVNHYVLSHYGADGILLWSQSTDGYIASLWMNLALGADRVCLAGTFSTSASAPSSGRMLCRSITTGQKLWESTFAQTSAPGSSIALRVLPGGDIAWLYFPPGSLTLHLMHLGRLGEFLTDAPLLTSPNTTPIVSINASGTTAIARFDESRKVMAVFAVDGSVIYPGITLDLLTVPQPLDLTLNDDGTALLTVSAVSSSASETVFSTLLGAHGSALWISPLMNSSDYQVGSPFAITSSVTNGSAYLSLLSYDSAVNKVIKLSMTDGHATWTSDISLKTVYPYDPSLYPFTTIAADASTNNLLLTASYLGKIRVTAIDAANGNIKSDRFESCLADYCSPFAAKLDRAGALHVAAEALDDTAGSLERIYVNDHPFANAKSIRLDQAGISGAWYPLYSGGQGFSLDYIASAHTIFMPWFTFSSSTDPSGVYGLNDPAGLAWYGLQGTVANRAPGADLVIAVTDPGSFNSGSAAARPVGTAHLILADCNSATLYYQFDASANSGAGGLITLTRLTPSTDPCTLADYTTLPAQNANPPAQGFDAHQSGSWYDPATSGQGIEMTIIPAGNGSNGLVFAAWFTFDPAGQSDDPVHQHWFTLQGDLASATSGKVTLPIYRIIGGAFDGAPTQNFSQVGRATLTMQGCDTAQFDYQFDTSEVAHAFAGLAGTSHLTKIGGCSAP